MVFTIKLRNQALFSEDPPFCFSKKQSGALA